ncbi:MAG TPA: MFS transporter [Anaerolineales bacterium]|nr:MFS transporter [Anaerolineales bacterium]HLO29606.1 MFS transporter [Anaerolineales bacterium]
MIALQPESHRQGPDVGDEKLFPVLKARKSPLAFGVGNFGISIFIETVKGFAYFYYVDWLGLALVSAAFVRTIFAIWDAIDDPLIGLLSDHTRSRWGRRGPWLMTAVRFMMLVFVAVFSVPAAFRAPQQLFVYMLSIMLLYETLNAILGINYSALYPELFRTPPERARVAVFCQTGNIMGVLVVLVLSPLFFQTIGFFKMAIMYALIGGSLLFFSVFYNQEGRTTQIYPGSAILPTLRSILADRIFWLFVLMMSVTFFSTNLVAFAVPFYVKYSLQARTEMISLLSGLAMLSALATMPAWTKLMKAWQIPKVFLVTSAVLGVSMIGFGVFPIAPAAGLSAVLFGGALQGVNVCSIVIRANLINRNINRTGNYNEASYYGLMNSGIRLGDLLHSLAMVLVGVLFGYVSGENPGPQAGLAFRFLISALPVAGLCLAALFARKFFNAFSQSQVSAP